MTVWIHSPFDNLPAEGFRKQRYWLMAEAFVAAGHHVVYWTADFNHGTKARRKLVSEAGADPRLTLRLVPEPAYARNVSVRRILSHRAYARRLAAALGDAPRPDLVVTATPTLGAASVLLRHARACGARFVVDIQDAWPETFARLLPRPLRFLSPVLLAPMYRTARRLYRGADLVTGVSERYRAIANRADYRVFRHGIVPVPSARPASKPPDGALLYVGNLGAGYDLETVLAALAADPRLTLDIAGRGPREDALRSRVRELGLRSRVRFHGYLAAEALRDLAARCSVGVVPMRDDSWVGLPYKLCDYLAAGLPVVSSLHGECGELLRAEGVGETYAFGSAASLAAALSRLDRSRPVALPACLDAARIYADYRRLCCALDCRRTEMV